MLLSETPPLQIPLLDHWHVFDLAAMLAAKFATKHDGIVTVVAQSPLYARELNRRLRDVQQPGRTHTLIWAGPEPDELPTVTAALEDYTHVIVIGGGRLSRLLREPSTGWRSVLRRLSDAGFEVEARYGFHGPHSLLWAAAVRLMQALHRDDLADRCLYRMRSACATPQTLLTTLNIVVLRKAHV